ncbi:MAG: glycosyltransferase family 4 protein [Proteobacteria bacterium]|nr:MAG: glycosyltransferase family 4 protein [Pseudomonadota bacterium]
MKIAIVHDWLYTYAGAEKVLEQILNCFPSADIYSLIDFIPDAERGFLHNKPVTTSFLQKMPFIKTKHRHYLPLMPLAIEQFDLSAYDVVISSSHAVAKGILTGPDQLHICYCHSPIRYAWDMQHQYLNESGANKGLKSWIIRYLLHKIRIWDYRTAHGVDYFIANSQFIARRIKKIYGRDAVVINPPVDTEKFIPQLNKEDFYFTASRLVPYKKISLIAEAFAQMPNKRLIIAGTGPEEEKVKRIAAQSSNITYLGYITDEVMISHLQRAKGFVFAAEEDFGIIPVEAQACGTPVIAFGKGGVLDSVIVDGEHLTGTFFKQQTIDSLIAAIQNFEKQDIKSADCLANAQKFSITEFNKQFTKFVLTKYHDKFN